MRGLAQTLGSSPATVNLAYRILRERGLIVTDGRRGTRVAPRPPLLGAATRDPASASARAQGVRDLSSGLPDPALLPSIADALHRVDVEAVLAMSESDRAEPALIELTARRVCRRWDPGRPSGCHLGGV